MSRWKKYDLVTVFVGEGQVMSYGLTPLTSGDIGYIGAVDRDSLVGVFHFGNWRGRDGEFSCYSINPHPVPMEEEEFGMIVDSSGNRRMKGYDQFNVYYVDGMIMPRDLAIIPYSDFKLTFMQLYTGEVINGKR